MGQIASAFATSHAFTFMEPTTWDEFRARNRESFHKRQGRVPPLRAEADAETNEEIERRFARIRSAHDSVRAQINAVNPDSLIVIGDDQNENLTSRLMPQIAIYAGGAFALSERWAKTAAKFHPHEGIAGALLNRGVAEGFDLASIGAFDNDELKSHAHAQILNAFLPDARIPVVLIFINAIHPPAVTPRRCYEFGELLRRVVADRPTGERVMICASGGLSHFTAGYPWHHYRGEFDYGSISEAFDRALLRQIEAGEGKTLADLTADDLMANGDIELRAWIALLGEVGAVPSSFTVYEPFYRAIMGMAVAVWPNAA